MIRERPPTLHLTSVHFDHRDSGFLWSFGLGHWSFAAGHHPYLPRLMFPRRALPFPLHAYDPPCPFAHRRPAPGERADVPGDVAAGTAERMADHPADGRPRRASREGRGGPP